MRSQLALLHTPHLLFMQAQQPLCGKACPAQVALKLSLCPILMENVTLVAGSLPLVFEVAIACGVGAVTVTAAETVGEFLVTVAVNVALQE